jgi:ParB-like chromosome segregation protein Spo0J
MKRVTVCGISYALPFAKLLPPLTEARYAELRADVAVNRVQQAIVTATTRLWGRIIVDGGHRALIAEELILDPPVVTLGDISEADAKQRCLALNLKRRHMTLDEQQAARQGRIARVGALADQGKTVREIAEIEQVSKSQVGRDLQLVPGGTKRRKRPPAQRALSNVTSLTGSVRAVLRDRSKRPTLEAIAAQHGIPLSGTSWPALDAIRAVLRDVVGGAASA